MIFISISQFRWIHENRTFTEDDITVDGLTSYISVSAVEENFGTYTCYVKNAIGNGIPCEIDVTGKYSCKQKMKKTKIR